MPLGPGGGGRRPGGHQGQELHTYQQVGDTGKKKDTYSKYRGKGKGRRCCLGDRSNSIPCHARYFAGRFEE